MLCLLSGLVWAQMQPAPSGQGGMGAASEKKERHGLFGMGSHEKAKLNETAPSFTLSGSGGRSYSLSDFQGKAVVLIWLNPDCPFSQRHDRESTLSNLARKYDPQKVQFVEINTASGTSSEARTNVIQLQDTNGEVTREYGVKRTPEVFIIGSDGKLLYHGAYDNDPEGKMSSSERKNYVDDALTAVIAGQKPRNQSTKPYGCAIKSSGAPAEGRMHWPGRHREGQQQTQPGGQSPSGSSY
jgi:peroxiredoxin